MSPRAAASATVDAPPRPQPPRSILRLVSRVRIAVMDALDAELAPYDISAAQMMVLGTIASGEADSASGLCKGISYDPGAMTRMIDRLEQKGLLRRLPRPDDRRTQSLELTPEGRTLFPKLAAAKEAVQQRFVRGFSEDEQRMLEGLLSRMLANR
jgi:DNA-binding MarR family transcriptional regulator